MSIRPSAQGKVVMLPCMGRVQSRCRLSPCNGIIRVRSSQRRLQFIDLSLRLSIAPRFMHGIASGGDILS
jgi:hypothetical protein